MAWGAAIGAGIAVAGQAASTWYANKQAREAVNRQISFQREAFRSRYQWQMQDMRQAGLNPILSYSQGPPAAPAGSSYIPESMGKDLSRHMATAVQAYQATNQAKQIRAETARTQKDEELKDQQINTEKTVQQRNWAETMLKNAQAVHESTKVKQTSTATELAREEIVLRKLQQIMSETRTQLLKAGVPEAKLEEELYKTGYGKFLKWLDKTGRSLNPFASSARNVAR